MVAKNAHLGVDTFVSMFGAMAARSCMVAGGCSHHAAAPCFFWGTWLQAEINATNYAPVTGMSMLWIYGVGYLTSIGLGLMARLQDSQGA